MGNYNICFYCNEPFEITGKGLSPPKFCSEECKKALKLLRETPEEKCKREEIERVEGLLKWTERMKEVINIVSPYNTTQYSINITELQDEIYKKWPEVRE